MTIDAIRKLHAVPAKRGMRVLVGVNGVAGKIVGARDGFLRVKIDATGIVEDQHASWKIDYIDSGGEVIKSCK